MHCRPMLAIIGATNYGKSLLGAHVLREVGKRIGVDGFLEVTVEGTEHLDFSDFDRRVHAGVLLDGIGDALLLKQNREALQGRPKLCKGARSATMMYSYKYTLCNRAVVATFDLAAANLSAFKVDHWLSSEDNVVVLVLKEKVFVDSPGVPSLPVRVQ